jgi:hypothetical protein
VLLLAVFVAQAPAQAKKEGFKFENIADSTQGLAGFSRFPAINNGGAVAFVATGSDRKQGVFKLQGGTLVTIASQSGALDTFSDDVVINSAGVVGYGSNTGGNDRTIIESDGASTKTIVDAKQQGLLGRFLGSPSINASSTAAFFAFRKNFSEAVFTGNGAALTTLADTADGNFSGFGNAAINSAGRVVFLGSFADGSQGVFLGTPVRADEANDSRKSGPSRITVIADASSTVFSDPGVSFGDPVINDAGTVADVAFLSNLNLVIFTGDAAGLTARTDPASAFFTNSEHPSLNNRGVVAFFASTINGGQGIYAELTGGASPVVVIEAGDTLFGSTVTAVDLGRFGLNDRDQLAFFYDLQDGRSGIAVVSLGKQDKQ